MPAWSLNAASPRFPFWGCLTESRTTHCTRDVIDPGLLLSNGAEVIPQTPCADPRSVTLLAIFPAAPASARSPKVRQHVSKTKAAFVSIFLRTLQKTHPILTWATLSSFKALASSGRTYAFLTPL